MAKMQVRRVGIFSYAKISAVITSAFGLIFGVIYGLIVIVLGAAILAGGGRDTGAAGGGSIVAGVLIMVGVPIFYGVLGFIFGALWALVYNIAAGFVGGVELELDPITEGYAAPPPPQWGAQQSQPGQQQQYPY